MQDPSDAEYLRVLEAIWSHPKNDQRPAVRRFLGNLQCTCDVVLDIGCGDGFYLLDLRPKKLVIVEPNSALRNHTYAMCERRGISVEALETVGSLCSGVYRGSWRFDLVLMIHVLFYLGVGELRQVLPKLLRYPLVMVYPDPMRAITVEFEDEIGMIHSRRKVALKDDFLGIPKRREWVDSHFRLPLETDIEALAFLISHPLLWGGEKDRIRGLARAFVKKHKEQWIRDRYLEMPQAQVMEFFGN